MSIVIFSDVILCSLVGGYVLKEYTTSTYRVEVAEIAGPCTDRELSSLALLMRTRKYDTPLKRW
jgi:hypothetical protein